MDEILKYTGQVPAKYSGAEMAVIEAQTNSPKILSMSINDISRNCTGYLTKAYVDAGFQIPDNATILIMSNSVADDLFTYFKTLSIKEAGLAIQNGIRGEYGEFMGINVKTCHQFFKAYQESFNRNEAIRKSKMTDEPEEKPTEQEINAIMDKACIDAFIKYKTTWQLVDFGGVKFTHLKNKGLINLTPERYAEIMKQAKEQVTAESTATIFKSGQESQAAEIAKMVLKDIDKHETVKNAARLIALREYFDYLIEFEMELTDLIN